MKKDFNVEADVWSVTSFNELRRDGMEIDHYNRMHPGQKAKVSYVEQQLQNTSGPIIAATDYMRMVAEQIRPYLVHRDYTTLGTDGYGRSDTRERLRYFFEVNAHFIVIAALEALSKQGLIKSDVVKKAFQIYGIQNDKPNPVTQ